jgi:hypothetical protein
LSKKRYNNKRSVEFMNNHRHVDFWTIFFGFVFFFGILGILYGIKLVVCGIILFIISLLMKKRQDKENNGFDALERIWRWEEGETSRPPEEDFKTAADFFMYRIDPIRKEDLDGVDGVDVPEGVKKYIKSEKELKRQTGAVF